MTNQGIPDLAEEEKRLDQISRELKTAKERLVLMQREVDRLSDAYNEQVLRIQKFREQSRT